MQCGKTAFAVAMLRLVSFLALTASRLSLGWSDYVET